MDVQSKLAALVASSKVFFGIFMVAIGWPLLSAWLNSASRVKDIESWEKWALAHPKLAAWVERTRALGLDPRKMLDIARREASRRAGQVPAESLMKMHLPPQVAGVLSDAEKRQKLVNFIMSLSEEAPKDPPKEPTSGTDGSTGG